MVSDDRRHHQIVWIQYGYIFFKYAKMGAATKLFDLKKEKKNVFVLLTFVTGPFSVSVTQPCSMRFRDLHVIMNLLPSFSSNGPTGLLSDDECSFRGLLRTCSRKTTVCAAMNQVQVSGRNEFNVKEFLQACQDQERRDSTAPLFWQSEVCRLSLRYTVNRQAAKEEKILREKLGEK